MTTQILESISSPSGAEINGFPFGPGANGETNDMALLAAQLQPVIDDLIAQGVNKIVLMSHLQQIAVRKGAGAAADRRRHHPRRRLEHPPGRCR